MKHWRKWTSSRRFRELLKDAELCGEFEKGFLEDPEFGKSLPEAYSIRKGRLVGGSDLPRDLNSRLCCRN